MPASNALRADDEPFEVRSPLKMPLRILLADDHAIVREGLRGILERHGFNVVGEASDGEEAVGRTLELRPHVAVLDLSMPVKNGIEASKEILKIASWIKIVLLTVHRGNYHVLQAFRAGVNGYVLKSRSSTDLIQAIYKVWHGEVYLSPEFPQEILREFLENVKPRRLVLRKRD